MRSDNLLYDCFGMSGPELHFNLLPSGYYQTYLLALIFNFVISQQSLQYFPCVTQWFVLTHAFHCP